MTKIQNHLAQIEVLIKSFEKRNEQVSSASIGWQLDHTLRVINGVCYSLVMSNPKKYKKDFNLNRLWIFTIKRIPRGNAKAPKQVVAHDPITKETLQEQLLQAKKLTNKILTLDKNAFFHHHIFGNLNIKNGITFLEIHTQHHLKIAEEIL